MTVVSIFSQNPAPVIKDKTVKNPDESYKVEDVRGNIKRPAVYLPKPPFPREALEAGADGIVKVEVTLDADGKVVTAKAVSGHPMLYQTAEETARQTIFRRSETLGPNGVETGVITYNFAIERASWIKIGHDLTIIQKASTLRPLIISRIAKAFEKDWTSELEMLGKLAEMRRVEIEKNPETNDKPVIVRKTTPNATTQNTLKAEIRVSVPIPNPPTPERIALAQNLAASLQSRLAADEANLWRFNAGVNLAKAFELFRRPNENAGAALVLRQSLESAPASISAETREALKKLIEIFERGQPIAPGSEIGQQIAILFNSK